MRGLEPGRTCLPTARCVVVEWTKFRNKFHARGGRDHIPVLRMRWVEIPNHFGIPATIGGIRHVRDCCEETGEAFVMTKG